MLEPLSSIRRSFDGQCSFPECSLFDLCDSFQPLERQAIRAFPGTTVAAIRPASTIAVENLTLGDEDAPKAWRISGMSPELTGSNLSIPAQSAIARLMAVSPHIREGNPDEASFDHFLL
ncbi:hypothetical protein ACU5AY_00825 [Rhizobium sp. PAMB 3174]